VLLPEPLTTVTTTNSSREFQREVFEVVLAALRGSRSNGRGQPALKWRCHGLLDGVEQPLRLSQLASLKGGVAGGWERGLHRRWTKAGASHMRLKKQPIRIAPSAHPNQHLSEKTSRMDRPTNARPVPECLGRPSPPASQASGPHHDQSGRRDEIELCSMTRRNARRPRGV